MYHRPTSDTRWASDPYTSGTWSARARAARHVRPCARHGVQERAIAAALLEEREESSLKMKGKQTPDRRMCPRGSVVPQRPVAVRAIGAKPAMSQPRGLKPRIPNQTPAASA